MQKRNLNLHENASHGKLGFGVVVYKNDFSTYFHQRIPWHWHEEIEFVVITKGTVEVAVSGNSFVLSEGEGVFFNANSLHNMKPATEENAYMFSILIHPGMLCSEQGYLLKTNFVEPYLTDHNMTYKTLSYKNKDEKAILKLLSDFDHIFFEEKTDYEYQLYILACQIWYTCIHSFWENRPQYKQKMEADQQRIYYAMQFIHEHFAETISLDDICDASSISRSECCRCFSRNLNMSPFAYLTSIRVSKAAERLRNTDESLTEIAIKSGFNDDSYFCKIFKKNIGCTPLAYRRGKTDEKKEV